MAPLTDKVISTVMSRAMAELTRLGYTPKSLEETQRDTFWWLWARIQAGLAVRPLLRGWGIAWSSSGYAELVPTEVPRPGRGKVCVLVHTSAVSPGTERAQYLKLPNTAVGVLGRPGYSASGVVAAVGPGVSGLRPGTAAAVAGAPHASVVTVPAAQVYPVHQGVPMPAAALVMLGIISGQGIRRAQLSPGDRFAVVGAGPIGAMALRLGALRATPVAVIARSRRREASALSGGAERFLLTGEDHEAIRALGAPVVIEATGDPAAVAVAVRATAPGGRVVLLGSSRGVSTGLPIDELQRKRVQLIGAHVDTLDADSQRLGIDTRRREGEAFLAALAEDSLPVEDLVGPAYDPREAGLFYRELAGTNDLVGAHFDWTRLADRQRRRRGRIVRPPNLVGAGMEASRPAGRVFRPAREEILRLEDPFMGAVGDLRVGIVGCGDIAVHNASGIARAPNARLTACFDPNVDLARDLADRHGAVAAQSAEALMSRDDVDAVFVCVPHHLHAPLAIQAAEHGCHVVVEKPQANDLNGAVAMVDAAERAGVTLSVCFPQRYHPAVVLARRLAAAGALGEFEGSLVRVFLDKSPSYWLGGFSGRSVSDWRSSAVRAGGGVLIMNVSHHVDLVRHVTGAEVESVTAVAATVDSDLEVEDAVSVGIRYANGALGSLVANSAVRGTTSTELSVWGRDGHLMLEPAARMYTLRTLGGLRAGRWLAFGRLPDVSMRGVYISRLASAITEGRPPDVPASAGLANQAFIEAVYRSQRDGGTVRPQTLVQEAKALT